MARHYYFCLLDDGSIEYKGYTGTPEAVEHLKETVGSRVHEVDQATYDYARPGDKFTPRTRKVTRVEPDAPPRPAERE